MKHNYICLTRLNRLKLGTSKQRQVLIDVNTIIFIGSEADKDFTTVVIKFDSGYITYKIKETLGEIISKIKTETSLNINRFTYVNNVESDNYKDFTMLIDLSKIVSIEEIYDTETYIPNYTYAIYYDLNNNAPIFFKSYKPLETLFISDHKTYPQ